MAMRAASVGSQSVAQYLVPVAHNQRLTAARTEGGAAVRVMHVAGVDVVQAFAQSDVARTSERYRRRVRDIGQLVVGMKRGEMQWNVRTELAHDPLGLRFDFGVGIVLAGNQQRRDLGPYARFMAQVDKRIEHRLQTR